MLILLICESVLVTEAPVHVGRRMRRAIVPSTDVTVCICVKYIEERRPIALR